MKWFSKTLTIWMLLLASVNVSAAKTYLYDTVPGDALKARIYTLDNGLKVYVTVNRDEPRIYTNIAVRVGSKNDPAETTGLAHYFEHMMFKGSDKLGTTNWQEEAPLVTKIDSLFEMYRFVRDSAERLHLYGLIDSISYLASTYSVPNEYFKAVSFMGATGTNAMTSNDQTIYVNNIPSNQLENWLFLESDRFTSPVLRLFHTELETIYEERNMVFSKDNYKVYMAALQGLFHKHPYGTQSTIGEASHIKNPSMKNIRQFFGDYYVPNNMAIALSGDLDPDETIRLVDQYFGKMNPKNIPTFTFEQEQPIRAPIVKKVYGQDAEKIMIGFRFKGAGTRDDDMVALIDMILANRAAGLIDLNLNQQQKVLDAVSNPIHMKDYSAIVLHGQPKEGQTLEAVRDLLLSQIELIKKGEFEDWLPAAIINDFKLNDIKSFESNEGRIDALVNAFIYDLPWRHEVEKYDRLSKITKQEIMNFARQNFNNNYVVVYKLQGVDSSFTTIDKPSITPIELNRDKKSAFLEAFHARTVPDLAPVFIDFEKDMLKDQLNANIPLLYKKNTSNETFELYYVFQMGRNHNKMLDIAVKYIQYLGTPSLTPEQFQQELYKLGCSFNVSAAYDRVFVSLSGLSKNMVPALTMFESWFTNPKPDQQILNNFITDILKQRENSKQEPGAIFHRLVSYGIYGPQSPETNFLSAEELKQLTAEQLTAVASELNHYEHQIVYYGNQQSEEVKKILAEHHKVPAELKPTPAEKVFTEQDITENVLYFVDYDVKQAMLLMLSSGEVGYNRSLTPVIDLYNRYFGLGMGSIIFQELREARSLAYRAGSQYQSPGKKDRRYFNVTSIGTQHDKIIDALTAIEELLNSDLKEIPKSFDVTKDNIMRQIQTNRITKSAVLFEYLDAQKLGLSYDIRRDVFAQIPAYTLADLQQFHQDKVMNRPHTYLLLGNKDKLDFEALKQHGTLVPLTMQDIFGY